MGVDRLTRVVLKAVRSRQEPSGAVGTPSGAVLKAVRNRQEPSGHRQVYLILYRLILIFLFFLFFLFFIFFLFSIAYYVRMYCVYHHFFLFFFPATMIAFVSH